MLDSPAAPAEASQCGNFQLTQIFFTLCECLLTNDCNVPLCCVQGMLDGGDKRTPQM